MNISLRFALRHAESKRAEVRFRRFPLGTIVTVFGAGSEMNAGAVITHEVKKIKAGIFGAQADFAFLDPEYSMSVPKMQVLSSAFDTLSHAMETYFGKPDENNLSDDINEATMRGVIRNTRILLTDLADYDARSELAWASAMAESGILKIGKVADFQRHQIEHRLGAYTDCNHGCGLAVIHSVLYAIFSKQTFPVSPDLSVGRTGSCHDNAVAESFFGTLKNEHYSLRKWATREEARNGAVDCIERRYNRNRPHSTIDYKVPAQAMDAFFERTRPAECVIDQQGAEIKMAA